MIADRSEWYTVEAAADALGVSPRRARDLLAGLPPEQVRESTGGRPRTLYHYSAHPALYGAWEHNRFGPDSEAQDSSLIVHRSSFILHRLLTPLMYLPQP